VLSPPSGAALRNRDPIADVLARVLPASGEVLEIGSGAGVHVVHFAERLPKLTWQPTEYDAPRLGEIDERAQSLTNVRKTLRLDLLAPWPVTHADAIVCINVLHASVPETVDALMRGASAVLDRGAPLVLYGPYRIAGAHTSDSNAEFDAWLKRERDPRFGVRDLESVIGSAEQHGLRFEERIAMPANNFVVVLRRV
jgi:cyclopropane fatty-acyl-phospholipid synthase-like methyltransferase